MSWLPLATIIMLAGFACAFVLCEWIVRRLDTRDRDNDSLV